MGSLLLLISIITIAGYFKTLWLLMSNYFAWSQHRFILTRWLFWVSMLIEEQLIVRISVSFFSIFLLYIMATLCTVSLQGINCYKPLIDVHTHTHTQIECDADEFELIMIEADVANKQLTFICFDPWVGVPDAVQSSL